MAPSTATLAAVDRNLVIVGSQVRAMHIKARPTCPSKLPRPTFGPCPGTGSPARHNQPAHAVCGMTERFWARRGLYKYAGHACPCALDARDALGR